MVRSRGGGLLKIIVLSIKQRSCTNDFIIIMTVCRDIAKTQGKKKKKIPAQRQEDGHEIPSLAEKLLAFGICFKREIQIFF